MPKILALDTSTDACSVALIDGSTLLDEFELAAKSHTQRALPMVHEVLERGGLKLTHLDAIAFACGPGSFTGLRIGMGVVQGLAFSAALPVIPVSTLMAMAYERLQNAREQTHVLAALDARMGEVYWGHYANKGADALPQLLSPEAVSAPDALPAAIAANAATAPVGVGSGFSYSALQELTDDYTLAFYPKAKYVAKIAWQLFQQGKAQDIIDVQPTYLRNTVSWKKRQRIRTDR